MKSPEHELAAKKLVFEAEYAKLQDAYEQNQHYSLDWRTELHQSVNNGQRYKAEALLGQFAGETLEGKLADVRNRFDEAAKEFIALKNMLNDWK